MARKVSINLTSDDAGDHVGQLLPGRDGWRENTGFTRLDSRGSQIVLQVTSWGISTESLASNRIVRLQLFD